MRWGILRSAVSLLLMLGLSACAPELGECDQEAALEIVYTPEGAPAFAGQAMINRGCGGGGFCHAEGIEADQRYGVPHGLDFDLRLASTTVDLREEEAHRLGRHQSLVYRMRGAIWQQVELGAMPPGGAAGEAVLSSIAFTYDRVADDGVTFAPLPELEEEGGRELLRNWLSCRTPVVERTIERTDGMAQNGFTVPLCERRCVDPTWPSIYREIMEPSCARGACHAGAEASAGLDLLATDPSSLASVSEVRERLVAHAPEGVPCRDASQPTLAPGDAMGSLLYLKMDTALELMRCGSLMPQSGDALSAQRLCALRAWIDCGACADPEDPACTPECLDEARSNCGVELGMSGEAECIDQPECPNHLDFGL